MLSGFTFLILDDIDFKSNMDLQNKVKTAGGQHNVPRFRSCDLSAACSLVAAFDILRLIVLWCSLRISTCTGRAMFRHELQSEDKLDFVLTDR